MIKKLEDMINKIDKYFKFIIMIIGFFYVTSITYKNIIDTISDLKTEISDRKRGDENLKKEIKNMFEIQSERADKRYQRASEWKAEFDTKYKELDQKLNDTREEMKFNEGYNQGFRDASKK